MRRLLAVQAQDLHAARRALRARTRRLTAVDVDRALTDERSIIMAWLGRGTLHMVSREDYPWMLALTAPRQATDSDRRLAQEGISGADAERALRAIEEALSDAGPLTRPELAARVAAQGIRTEGQAMPHLLRRAALRGTAVLGPIRGARQAFALTRDWLDAEPATGLAGAERDSALAELGRRYLAGHGPATAGDLAYWAGLPLRDARAGLEAIAGELAELDDGLVELAAGGATPRRIAPRLLPAFDAYMLGWKDRRFAVPAEQIPRVYSGGMVSPAATADGRMVGTWRAARRGRRLALEIEPFEELPSGVEDGLRGEAGDVARFEGLELA